MPKYISELCTSCIREQKHKLDDQALRIQKALDQLCVQDMAILAKSILQERKVESAEGLCSLVNNIHGRVLIEPHFLNVYADLFNKLDQMIPPVTGPEDIGPYTCKRVLLNTVQNYFVCMLSNIHDEDETETLHMRVEEGKFLTNVRFAGMLFLKRLLSGKLICNMLGDLMEFAQESHMDQGIDCACELVATTGERLEKLEYGRDAIEITCASMGELKDLGLIRERTQMKMQSLFDMKNSGWIKKVDIVITIIVDDAMVIGLNVAGEQVVSIQRSKQRSIILGEVRMAVLKERGCLFNSLKLVSGAGVCFDGLDAEVIAEPRE